jgi:hypothetical protein
MALIQAANREDVLRGNGFTFYEQQFHELNGTPEGFTESVSGGGTVTYTTRGVQLEPGSTVGDTAVLNIGRLSRFNNHGLTRLYLIYETLINGSDVTASDKFRMGGCSAIGIGDNDSVACLSFHEGQLVAGNDSSTVTRDVLTEMNNNERAARYMPVIIDYDYNNNEVVFRHLGWGKTYTLDVAPPERIWEPIVQTESDGVGDFVRLSYFGIQVIE